MDNQLKKLMLNELLKAMKIDRENQEKHGKQVIEHLTGNSEVIDNLINSLKMVEELLEKHIMLIDNKNNNEGVN